MFKRYLVVLGALVVPILLAVASQVLSAPVPPAGLSPEPIVLTVTGTVPGADPGAEKSPREVLQHPQLGVPGQHAPGATAAPTAAASLTTWGPAGDPASPAPAGSSDAPTGQDDEPEADSEEAGSDER